MMWSVVAVIVWVGSLPQITLGQSNDTAFDCAIRQLAYQYGQQLVTTDLMSLHDALDIRKYCHNTTNGVRTQSLTVYPGRSGSRGGGGGVGGGHPTLPFASVTYYVATNGHDTNPGTKASPFATLERAQAVIRGTPVHKRVSTIVYVREGTYYLPQPVTFTDIDSGSGPSRRISYAAYTGETVVLSGGRRLTGLDWKPDSSIPGAYVAQGPIGLNVTELFVEGQRCWKARYPNGNPAVPSDGYSPALPVECSNSPAQPHRCDPATLFPSNVHVTSTNGTLLATGSMNPLTQTFNFTVEGERPQGEFINFHAYHGGRMGRFDTTYNYPYWDDGVPSEMSHLPGRASKWGKGEGSVVHMYHPQGWGNWMFEVDDIKKDTVSFLRGGFQEARGSHGKKGGAWFISGLQAELDSPNEFFSDPTTGKMWLVPPHNVTLSPNTLVEASVHDSVITVRGTPSSPVRHLGFHGFIFRHTNPTFLKPYEVPSGGDWSIHRGGALFLTGVSDIEVAHCTFDGSGGNAVFVSNYARGVEVHHSLFRFLGDNPVAMVGHTDLMDGRAMDVPQMVHIHHNHMHDWGVWGKQTAAVFQAVSCNNTVAYNVMYNGPRPGINWNDGFGGGSVIEYNLVFNTVRETADHGVFNSWDRQKWVYLNGGVTSLHPAPRWEIGHNFMFKVPTTNRYCIDHDDASSFYQDHHNVCVYGGIKFRDGQYRSSTSNLVLYPSGTDPYVFCPQVNGFPTDEYINNTIVHPSGQMFGFCRAFDPTSRTNRVVSDGNTYYTRGNPKHPFHVQCGGQPLSTFTEWQKLGYDVHGRIADDITLDAILDLVKGLLHLA